MAKGTADPLVLDHENQRIALEGKRPVIAV